jgi:hypothetical protein
MRNDSADALEVDVVLTVFVISNVLDEPGILIEPDRLRATGRLISDVVEGDVVTVVPIAPPGRYTPNGAEVLDATVSVMDEVGAYTSVDKSIGPRLATIVAAVVGPAVDCASIESEGTVLAAMGEFAVSGPEYPADAKVAAEDDDDDEVGDASADATATEGSK